MGALNAQALAARFALGTRGALTAFFSPPPLARSFAARTALVSHKTSTCATEYDPIERSEALTAAVDNHKVDYDIFSDDKPSFGL